MKNKEKNIFLEDIEMPEIVDEKIAETLLKIKMEEKDIMRKKRKCRCNKERYNQEICQTNDCCCSLLNTGCCGFDRQKYQKQDAGYINGS